MSENEEAKDASEEKAPACPECAAPKPEEKAPECAACSSSKAPSKSFLTTLIVIIVLFVLVWLGVKWYNGDFSSGNEVVVEETTEIPMNP